MKKGISICDKCKKEVVSENQYATPKNWGTFTIRDNNSRGFGDYHESIEMMLCDECCKKINITPTSDIKKKDIREELYNVLYSILTEIAEQLNQR